MKNIILLVIICALYSCADNVTTNPCEEYIYVSPTEIMEGPYDPLTVVQGAVWDGECLHIDVSYTGCESNHDIKAVVDGSIIKTSPPKITIYLIHDNQDVCDAVIAQRLSLNIDLIDSIQEESEVILLFDNSSFTYLLEK